jgi:hypothetical protein
MERKELEQEVIKRLKIDKDSSFIPTIKKSLKLKDTKELEDILERMKADGR